MAKNLKDILSKQINLPKEVQEAIFEAWDNKIEETKAELRVEYAKKYEHDRNVLAEAMDKFLSDQLRVELEEFAQDKAKLVQERIAVKKKLKEQAKKLDAFVTSILSEEMAEFRKERIALNEGLKRLENFTIQQLSEEIAEFHKDKQALAEQKVKLVAEGKKTINEAREKFIKRAAKLVEETVTTTLETELKQFKDDIQAARENDFGRRIFESFASEFMTSYLSEGSESKKLKIELQKQAEQLKQLQESIDAKEKEKALLESKLAAANDRIQRSQVMGRLLSPLAGEKRQVMKDLLESVQTQELEKAFNKYLPAVLNESSPKVSNSRRQTLAESVKEKTGNRATQAQITDLDGLTEIKRLAGL